ncbi:MAG: hypothetical protein WDM89_13375 [Rhizomicrobium sp.]
MSANADSIVASAFSSASIVRLLGRVDFDFDVLGSGTCIECARHRPQYGAHVDTRALELIASGRQLGEIEDLVDQAQQISVRQRESGLHILAPGRARTGRFMLIIRSEKPMIALSGVLSS